MPPVLLSRIDGAAGPTLVAPAQIAPRAWILGVVAVQLTAVDGLVTAQLRAHTTGQPAPTVVPLVAPAIVHVALVADPGAAPRWPAVAVPPCAGAAARLTAFLDGQAVADSALDPALVTGGAARGFGHVFCRWLRDGGVEPGFDLTVFAAHPPGRMFERLLVRPLTVGQIVSYSFSL